MDTEIIDKLKAEYRYYGATLDLNGIQDLEFLLVLGAFLASEQNLKFISNEERSVSFERYNLKHNPPDTLAEVIAKHFPLTIEVEDEPDESERFWHQENYQLRHQEAQL
jgi:hypothetical protein